MKINKLIRIHLQYVLNKTIIIIFVLLSIFLLLYFLLISNSFSNYSYRWLGGDEINRQYYYSVVSIFKIIIPLFIVYIYGSSFLDENDNYRLLLINTKIDKIMYFITKFISINIIVFVAVFLLYTECIIVGEIFIIKFNGLQLIDELFIIYLISILFGLEAIICTIITSKSVGYVFIIILFVIIEGILSYNGDELNILNYLFPSFIQTNDGFSLVMGYSHLIICIIFNLLISLILYHYKDM